MNSCCSNFCEDLTEFTQISICSGPKTIDCSPTLDFTDTRLPNTHPDVMNSPTVLFVVSNSVAYMSLRIKNLTSCSGMQVRVLYEDGTFDEINNISQGSSVGFLALKPVERVEFRCPNPTEMVGGCEAELNGIAIVPLG
ncbi:hypothetical protein [Lederbergia lenta]|uniref:Uncharacterized protein n=1 Tax=Lederbergia lenta TaxID=1467 RepID=A0A2X4ZAQ7_LEDLE|nr:hypothetical protein [Lederbergia lenta]MCM3113488.1 hypothetical protein [Lederbergia lenta]MEC2326728.1 hypothetical protein [Lederbergia lenta]SQI61525.1 Uncharacterised protein [Lederbergia lenta]